MSKVTQWIDEELARDRVLARQVEMELTRLRLEQDLVALREDEGISQRELARRIGVSQPVIARIEAGRARNLELRTLLRIAAALNGEVHIRIGRRRAAPRCGAKRRGGASRLSA